MRITKLDGLRGLAALVVLMHHFSLTDPWFAEAINVMGVQPGGVLQVLLNYTPMHALIDGRQAVLLFFTLSGFVLAGVTNVRSSFSLAFQLPRFTRLYLPIVASLLLALGLSSLRVDHIPSRANGTWWTEGHLGTVSLPLALIDPKPFLDQLCVWCGTGWLNSSLWSMRVELFFTLVFGIVLALARLRAFGLFLSFMIATFLPTVVQYLDWAQYLGFFTLGALLARNSATKKLVKPGMWASIALLAFSIPWVARLVPINLQDGFPGVALSVAGSAAALYWALGETGSKSILNSHFLQYFGSRSYSLYLVHAPVLVWTHSWWFGSDLGNSLWFARWPVSILLALACTEIFFRAVETPSISLAKNIRSKLLSNSRES